MGGKPKPGGKKDMRLKRNWSAKKKAASRKKK